MLHMCLNCGKQYEIKSHRRGTSWCTRCQRRLVNLNEFPMTIRLTHSGQKPPRRQTVASIGVL